VEKDTNDRSSSIFRSKYTKYRIITLCVIVLIAASAVVVWYYLSIPKIILTLEFEQGMSTGLFLNNIFKVREVLPDPLEPLTFPDVPNPSVIIWGSCRITTARGSASSQVMYMFNFVTNTSASQATNGKMDDYILVEYTFFFFVDNQNALDLLSDLGIPAQLVDINYLDKTIDETTNHMMVTIADGQNNLLLNLTFLYNSEPLYNPDDLPEHETIYKNKWGWIFGEEGNLNAIRRYYSGSESSNHYNYTKGIIDTSSLLSIHQVLGDSLVIPPQGANEVKLLHIFYGAKEQFINP
jgi:hypothetical protein